MKISSNLRIVILCIMWYLTSSVNNIIAKQVLTQFEYPMTLTLVQLLSVSIYSEPLLRYIKRIEVKGTHKLSSIPRNYFIKFIIPLGFGKFSSSVLSHISIWMVPVSYAHTVKGTIPFFTVLFSFLIYGEIPSAPVVLSLVPIIAGVCIATATELSFNIHGLTSALLATAGFSLQSIFSKKVLKDTHLTAFGLLALLGRVSLILFIPFWIYFEGYLLLAMNGNIINENIFGKKGTFQEINNIDVDARNYFTLGVLIFLDGLFNFLQNIMAFTVLSKVTPLTYSVANTAKRVFVIALSILFLKNAVTFANLCGISLAIGGIFGYNKAKIMENERKYKLPIYSLEDHNSNKIII